MLLFIDKTCSICNICLLGLGMNGAGGAGSVLGLGMLFFGNGTIKPGKLQQSNSFIAIDTENSTVIVRRVDIHQKADAIW